uniref:Ac45-VOA1_TM domain-containing protein n=1 Tax=Strongyloides papillosus TaxID=174720 RepID=A0A0N5B8H3_STREA
MRILGILSLLSFATAYDYLIWSKDKELLNVPLTKLAYQENTVVFDFKDFSLAQFSKLANVYSNDKSPKSELIETIKESFYKTGFFNGYLNISEIKHIFETDNWNEIEEALKNSDIKNKAIKYAFIIINLNDLKHDSKRSKRVASSALGDFDVIPDDESPTFSSKVPVIMPPYEKGKELDDSPCLFYLEGITLIHHSKVKSMVYKSITIDFTKDNSNDKFTGSFDCNNITKTSTFNVKITTKGAYNDDSNVKVPKNTDIEFEITVEGNGFYSWKVSSLTLKKGTISVDGKDYSVNRKKLSSQKGSNFLDIDGYYDYAYACSQTPAIFALSDVVDNYIGISLFGLQLQMHPGKVFRNIDGEEIFYGFSNNVNDCVPTFSPGSWMGIIVSLICISILLFGYQMISHLSQSVKMRK